jgi:hypothetical protein
MSNQTGTYRPLVIGLAATLGVVAGIVLANFRFKLPKLMKGG